MGAGTSSIGRSSMSAQAIVEKLLSGGKAHGRPDSDFSADQLLKGRKVEMEHTDDKQLAHAIAKDHLSEIPDYYDRLAKMEESAKKEAPMKKQAGDMPHFLDQDRPAKVKEIYSAIKRDHPDMPAEMKARIAARKGKKSPESRKPPETGGPKYKAPITPWHEKQSALNLALGQLWSEGPGQFPKHAAASYFTYRVNKDERDQNALGSGFCKLAHHIHKEPWDLAKEVVRSYRGMEYLAKTASNPDQRELAQFYVAWSDGIIKKAGNPLLQGASNLLQRGASAAKAGVQALAPSSVKMTRGIQAVEAGAPIAAGKGVGGAISSSLKKTKALQEMGGGSVARGQTLHAENQAARAAKSAPAPAAVTPAPTAVPGGGTGGVPAAEAKPTMKDYAWGIGVPALAGAGLGYGVASANS